MRIGVEGRTLQGNRYGVARYLTNMLNHLQEIDPENEYILYTSRPIDRSGLPDKIIVKTIRMKPGILWRHLRLPLAMLRDRVDLHYSPSYFVPMLKLCPTIASVYDITFKVHPEWFAGDKRFRFDEIFWWRVKKAERIVTCSLHSKNDITKILEVKPSRVKVIYPAADDVFGPVDDKKLITGIKQKYGVEGKFLFTAGAIHTRRNLKRLIEALALARESTGLDLKLLILGEEAPFTPPVDIEGTAKKHGVEDCIVRAEYVPEQDLLLLYNACDLFVYPSLYEGFGLPVIEAMSCGTPVACSSITSIPEVAGDAAIYFDPANVQEMADAVSRGLNDDTLRKNCRQKGMERASRFSWRNSASELFELFNEVMRRN
ncbi:MAG: glycosyltransferase family 4 protein [Actinobacteria bacterium]|nr:glycosyltransferase family 4 protein [Actinomycetota bacterium]